MRRLLSRFDAGPQIVHFLTELFSKRTKEDEQLTAKEDEQLTANIEILLASTLLDPDWYRATYPDVQGTPVDIARHYLKFGAREGRNPHPLFSTNFYFQEYPDVVASGMNPLLHYLNYGGRERRNPHPLFDAKFYLDHNIDVKRSGINPLQHFLEFGGREGRDPNPYFSSSWYLDRIPELAAAKINPLVHYTTVGEADGLNPSDRFEVDWYLRCNLDVVRARVSPLAHFLQDGWKEGREPTRAYGLLGEVTDADMYCVKKPSLKNEMALFVTHSPQGTLKPHVRYYLDSLNRHGVSTTLIVAADAPFSDADANVVREMNGIFIRENIGYDFAAWAHVLRDHPMFFDADILYFINDSVIGPTSEDVFGEILRKVRQSAAGLIGLTDSHESGWHIQSFFLAFKRPALSSNALRDFLDGIVSFARKTSVIAEYETQLALVLTSAGVACEVVLPQEVDGATNRTLFHWKSLLEAGFPFIKVSTIRDSHPDVDVSDWRTILASQGYDIAIAERTLAESRAAPSTEPAQLLSPPTLQSSPGSLVLNAASPAPATEFDPEFYLAIYPDIVAAGVDPYDHYVKHGRIEGRLARMPEELDVLDRVGVLDGTRETVLVVSHEAVKGGAPVLAYNLVRGFLNKYNVIILFLSAGPILKSCSDAGATVVGPVGLAGSSELAEMVVKRIARSTPIKFAVSNTIASRYVLPALARLFIPSVSLIHEFAAYIRPRHAFRDAVLWSGETVFSTEITRHNAVSEYPELAGRDYPVIPQGLCIVPDTDEPNPSIETDESSRVRKLLRPDGFSAEGLVILGAGFVEFRKGVDLFIDCAARVLSSGLEVPCRFAWVGRGYNPDADVAYSVYLADQVKRAGIADNFCFVSEVSDLSVVYEMADMLLLTSRLDPLPNVAIDALSVGLPVLCFAGTTGIADVLITHGLGDHTVSGYLDTGAMADKVVRLARSKYQRAQVAAQSVRIVETAFDMNRYLARIEDVAARQVVRAEQERRDVETIAASDLPRMDFFLRPDQRNRSREDAIREYVRTWASGIGRRKLFPGFHPGIYREQHGLNNRDADPLADYLRAGQPAGSWACDMIGPNDGWNPVPSGIRIGMHIHAYFLDVLPEIITRLMQNSVRPDLLVTVKSKSAMTAVRDQLEVYRGGRVRVHLVPDPGRDVGPFLTEFGQIILDEYDLIGHFHTKRSADVADSSVGKIWTRFMLENVLGGTTTPMADIILSRMVEDPTIGLVFGDDPHVISWDDNREFVEPYRSAFVSDTYPENLHFPVGAMFWARSLALKPMFDLGLSWSDYPVEPLPYDGSLLHGLERLYGLSTAKAGFRIVNTNVPGLTR